MSKVTSKPILVEKTQEQADFEFDLNEFEDINAEQTAEVDKDALMAEIRKLFATADKDKKAQVKALLKSSGVAKLDDSLSVSELNTIKGIFET